MNSTTAPEFNRKAILSLVLGGASVACACVAGIPAIVLGIWAFVELSRNRNQRGAGMAFTGIVAGIAMLLVQLVMVFYWGPKFLELPGMVSQQTQHGSKLSTIAKAMIAHDADKGALPGRAICDKNGQPILSWRVALLPYLGEKALFDEFKLDEPWNSPHNEKLLPRMPKVYLRPTKDAKENHTSYVVIHGKGAAFEGCKGVPLKTFTDGMMTILVAETRAQILWTSPEDIDYDMLRGKAEPAMHFQGIFPGELSVGLATGQVHRIKIQKVSEKTFHAAITRNANDVLGPDWE